MKTTEAASRKYYIIAGEASGDMHAANLLKEIAAIDKGAVFRGWGGDKMQKQGCKLVKHYRELAFMGFIEVIANLRTILKNIVLCKRDILEFKPDIIILVDYPGFNLRIAEFAKTNNIKVFYYISPQVWAWKQSRVKKIKRDVDKMFVILPFEKNFYEKHDYEVEFVGHPLLDEISHYKNSKVESNLSSDNKRVIAILPGSRKQEIMAMLPIMLKMIPEFPDYRFIIAGVSTMPKSFYSSILKNTPVEIIYDDTYSLLSKSWAAIVTSGTATLETALFKVPEVVCYKGSLISFALAKKLVNIEYISLCNLIMEREIVKELIQKEFNIKTVKHELEKILDKTNRSVMNKNFDELSNKLGGAGASKKTASIMVKLMNDNC